jgi:hypothetical protein
MFVRKRSIRQDNQKKKDIDRESGLDDIHITIIIPTRVIYLCALMNSHNIVFNDLMLLNYP